MGARGRTRALQRIELNCDPVVHESRTRHTADAAAEGRHTRRFSHGPARRRVSEPKVDARRSAHHVNHHTHPPAEIEAVLSVMRGQVTALTLESIPQFRQVGANPIPLTLEELAEAGVVRREVTVEGY